MVPGTWSDLALACLIHVGMKRLTPDQDSGLGIEGEEQEAVRLHGDEGMKGCWVFTGNPERRAYLRQRLR